MTSRVVITGMGLCSSLGASPEAVRETLLLGRTAFRESPVLAGQPVCPVEDEGEDEALLRLSGWRYRRYLSRAARLAVLAGLRAHADAGLKDEDGTTGLIGTASPTLAFESEKGLPPGDPLDLDAMWLLRWLPNTPVSALAALLGLHGEGSTLGCACASGLAALGEAWLRVRHGIADRILVACGDSRLSLGGLLGYSKARVLGKGDDPEAVSRPFDAARNGFVPGEGGAAFMVESLESARARGAKIHAELLGYGATLDGGSLSAPDASGTHAEKAVRKALETACAHASDIAWVSAHGTGTRLNDSVEAALLERVFGVGKGSPAVTAVKSWIGHTSAASGAIETAIVLSSLKEGCLPPVRNLASPITGLNLVRGPGTDDAFRGSVGLVESFGFGGQNAALVLRAGGVE